MFVTHFYNVTNIFLMNIKRAREKNIILNRKFKRGIYKNFLSCILLSMLQISSSTVTSSSYKLSL